MAKKRKKNKGDKRDRIVITQIEIIQSSRNPLHYEHITNGLKGGAFGGSKRDQRRKARRESKLRSND